MMKKLRSKLKQQAAKRPVLTGAVMGFGIMASLFVPLGATVMAVYGAAHIGMLAAIGTGTILGSAAISYSLCQSISKSVLASDKLEEAAETQGHMTAKEYGEKNMKGVALGMAIFSATAIGGTMVGKYIHHKNKDPNIIYQSKWDFLSQEFTKEAANKEFATNKPVTAPKLSA